MKKIEAYLFLFVVLALIGFCSYAISRVVYKKLKKNENKNATAIGVVIFILSYAIIISTIAFVLSKVLYFGR